MKLLNKFKYMLPSFITAVIFFFVLFIKGLYPFGSLTVDYYDMAQQISAFYYHIYDVLHGTKSLFYDPYTAMSVNMAMSTSGCSHLSIFNLFFLFIKRDMLLESLSFFLGLKMILMSLSMYLYIHKTKNIPYFFELLFSVGYAFCGFVMVLYVTIQWMDIAILFPLIMLFLHKLLNEGKSIGYIITLSMALIASYYLSFMILIYIVLFTGLELFATKVFDRNDSNIKRLQLTSLLVETCISLILSAFIIIPQLKQTLASARFNNESSGAPIGLYLEIINTVKPAYTTRWFSLLGLSFAFAIIFAGIIRYRKDKKLLFLSITSVIIIVSELFLESVNLIWHFGSYVQYPIRNGFMIYFTVAVCATAFIEKDKIELSGFSHVVIAAVIMIFALYNGIRAYSRLGILPVRNVFHITALIMAVSFILCFLLYFYGKGRLSAVIPVIVIAEIIFYSFIFIGKPTFTTGYSEEPEQEGEYIHICNQISELFDIKPDSNNEYLLSRIKNPDESLNANYGLVLRKPALSNWTHLLNPGLSDSAKKMGYSVQFTRLLDAGGTVFSDALIGIKQIISNTNQNEKLYTPVASKSIEVDRESGKTAIYNLYECQYTLPFGYIGKDADLIDFEKLDTCQIYNELYNSLGGNGIIAQWEYNDDTAEQSLVSKKLGSVASFSHNSYIVRKKALYYMADQVDRDDYNTEIKVNGEKVLIPSIKEEDNTLYPAHFNNNAVLLGVYENELVQIEARFSRIGTNGENIDAKFSPKILSINMELLESLCQTKKDEIKVKAGKSSYSYSLTASKGQQLVLPLSYDKGYSAYVNSSKTEVKSVGDIFIAIPLEEGQNEVFISFMPDGLKTGSVISLIGIIIFILFAYYGRKKAIKFEIPYFENICIAGFICIFIVMYFIPFIFGVYKCIM